jgi:hypothetical protein
MLIVMVAQAKIFTVKPDTSVHLPKLPGQPNCLFNLPRWPASLFNLPALFCACHY